MTKPPANDLSRSIAALRIAVAELSPAGGEACPPASIAPPVRVEPPEAPQAPITTSTPAGERRDKTAATRKARWKRRREEGARWVAYEIDADWIDILIASGELPEAERHNRESIASALLDLAEEGLRARYGTVVALRASLTRLVTRSPAR